MTAGIWRPIALEAWSTARIASVRPLVDVRRADGPPVCSHVHVEWSARPARPAR